MEKVSCVQKGEAIPLDEAMNLFHLADENCMMCTNYENCKAEFWKRREEDNQS